MESDRSFIDRHIEERRARLDRTTSPYSTKPVRIDGGLEASIKDIVREGVRSRYMPTAREREAQRERMIRKMEGRRE
ncbi:MAG: hypothetical protein A3D74_01095 [Candidatus Levybacteria bacterium RIFCSPHIGHO2_02_FULL_37_13]|nr:MAG: hypothetical protein A3D74_01095 [Candidatus Levybacteria bacterium RIFCSPHIGHO2_02_FULL_37_13]OGH30682.1 MAG: hypothetical protein A3E40_04445 [Candidatus Levybacteria bacterium RIFCSPHIGHO2_12_FULL_37_9]